MTEPAQPQIQCASNPRQPPQTEAVAWILSLPPENRTALRHMFLRASARLRATAGTTEQQHVERHDEEGEPDELAEAA